MTISISALLVAAFNEAKRLQKELPATWVSISYRIGRHLRASLLVSNVQHAGDVDMLIRSLEDETAQKFVEQASDELLSFHYQNLLSIYWIGGFYEILRLLRERGFMDAQQQEFESLLRDFEFLRIPLEKHEIAKDRILKEPLELSRYPLKSDNTNNYSYESSSNDRAHIMPSGISSRGSAMWQVIDLKNKTQYWIERRSLSDRIIALWGNDTR